jgi:hypothetical protein
MEKAKVQVAVRELRNHFSEVFAAELTETTDGSIDPWQR